MPRLFSRQAHEAKMKSREREQRQTRSRARESTLASPHVQETPRREERMSGYNDYLSFFLLLFLILLEILKSGEEASRVFSRRDTQHSMLK